MDTDGKQPAQGASHAAAPAPQAERRLSLPLLLAPSGSLGLLGSQELSSLLDSTIQHMQTLSKQDLELLTSPKWRALLSWDEEAGNSSSPMHLDTGGSSASRMPQHCDFGSGDVGQVASPGVSQDVSAAELAAAWKLVQAQAQGQGAQLILVPQSAQHPSRRPSQQAEQQQPQPPRRTGGAGKKRPCVQTSSDSPPTTKKIKREPKEEGRLAAETSGDATMLDAEAAAAVAGIDGGEFGSPQDLSLSPDVVAGLNRVRLNSITSPAQQRKLTAAAAAAAITPIGRLAGVRRVESNVAMLVAQLPGSPIGGAGALCASPEMDCSGDVPAAPLAIVKPEPPSYAALRQQATPVVGGAMPPPPPRSMAQASVQRQQLPSKSRKAVATGQDGVFTSPYRGVTRHKLTGRYEAHFWDSSYVRPNVKKGGRAKGRQIYLGGYETELEAARAYDRAVIAHCGSKAPLNFPVEDYSYDMSWIKERTADEVVGILRRGSVGFARGQSQYRGVTRHHQQGKWEARIGKVEGNKYLYLGTYDTAEEAARAYDKACVKFRGSKAILNFDLSYYQDILDNPDDYEPMEGTASSPTADTAAAAMPSSPGPSHASTSEQLGLAPAAAASMPAGAGPAVSPAQMAAAMAAAMAGGGLHAGALLLPLLHPLANQPLDATQQPMATSAAAASQAEGGPRLPAIRTRAGAAALAAAVARSASLGEYGLFGGGAGASPASGAPGSAGGLSDAAGLDLSDFMLLSPLGLSGTPNGWKDSPLGRLATGELSRLLSGINSPVGLFTSKHRLHNSSSGVGGGIVGGSGVGGGPSRLQSATREMDLLSALQWLDSLDPSQVAALSTMDFTLESPGTTDGSGAGPATGGKAAGPATQQGGAGQAST